VLLKNLPFFYYRAINAIKCRHKYITNTNSWDYGDTNLLMETLDIMEQDKLVNRGPMPDYAYYPSAKGYRIKEQGGWLEHIRREDSKRKFTRTLNRSIIVTNVTQWVFGAGTLIIILFGLYTSIIANRNSEKSILLQQEQNQIEAQQLQLQMLDFVYRKHRDRISVKQVPISTGKNAKK